MGSGFKLTTGKLDEFGYFMGVSKRRRVSLLSRVASCGWVDRFLSLCFDSRPVRAPVSLAQPV